MMVDFVDDNDQRIPPPSFLNKDEIIKPSYGDLRKRYQMLRDLVANMFISLQRYDDPDTILDAMNIIHTEILLRPRHQSLRRSNQVRIIIYLMATMDKINTYAMIARKCKVSVHSTRVFVQYLESFRLVRIDRKDRTHSIWWTGYNANKENM